MRIVGIENIICDYYFWEYDVYINGGGTVANILINLDSLQMPCKLIGYCGDDLQGKWILKTLKKTNIDIESISIINTNTKTFYIKDGKTSSYCPLCHTKKKRYPNIKIEYILPNLKSTDILLLKDYSKINEKIIWKTKNEKLIDMSAISSFLYLPKKEIISYLKQKFKIMNINETLLLFLQKKLKLSKKELLSQLNSELIIITKGKEGVEFYYKNNTYSYQLEKPFDELETNGCGDAFFSQVIYYWLSKSNNPKIDFQMIFQEGNKLVEKVLQNIGARNHIIPNQKIETTKDCICETFKIE